MVDEYQQASIKTARVQRKRKLNGEKEKVNILITFFILKS